MIEKSKKKKRKQRRIRKKKTKEKQITTNDKNINNQQWVQKQRQLGVKNRKVKHSNTHRDKQKLL